MKSYMQRFWFFLKPKKSKKFDNLHQKTYSGTVEKDSARYVITYLLTDTEYTSFMSLGLIPANTSEVLGHVVVPDDFVEAVSAMGLSERERIEKAGGATQ
jgi:hypothetical protein